MKLYEPFQFLTAEECDRIIDYARQSVILPGRTLRRSNKRKNRIVWYKNSEQWEQWIDMLNTIEDVVDWIQPPQISFYRPGEQYDWHVDTWPNYRTHIRHFTLTCELQSAPKSRLELQNYKFDALQKGQAIVFKPQDSHRATSPDSGERISLTIWAMAKNLTKH